MGARTDAKVSHSLKEEELPFGKLALPACDGRENECERKCCALDQSRSDRRANRPAVTRHGECADEIASIVRVHEEERRIVPSTDGVGGGGQGGGAGERSDQEVGARQTTERDVERGVVKPRVGDSLTRELRREGERRLNDAPVGDEGGECGCESGNRWVRWAGDEEDPHGGDDGILA